MKKNDIPSTTYPCTINGYVCDKYGRTRGYIRKNVSAKMIGFISNVEEVASTKEPHPSDVFFLVEHCSPNMSIFQGLKVEFRMVLLEIHGEFKMRAVDIIPLLNNPPVIVDSSLYRDYRRPVLPESPVISDDPYAKMV